MIRPRELEVIALQLFIERGFDQTTVEDIASEARISRRTFHRYFSTKTDVLWHGFDDDVERLKRALVAVSSELTLLDGIREAVIAVNQYTTDDISELRDRMELVGSVPALQASAAARYDAWERVIASHVSSRTDHGVDSLYALGVGRTVLAACRTAFDVWVQCGDGDLTAYLDKALRSLSSGFKQ